MSAPGAIGPQITVYAQPNYKGALKTCYGPEYNLAFTGFDNRIASLEVTRGVWILYEEDHFGGNIYVVWEGQKINNLPMRSTSSLKPIEVHFPEDHSITLHNGPSFTGANKTFTSENPNLIGSGFQDSVISVVVDSGAWVCYEHINYGGHQYLFTRGAYNGSSSEGHFENNKMSSLKPIVF
ncbi:beta-crystallin B2-like [Mizuhopecten yessoensis]|uniref:Beta-crystallin B2 n=1 Tax=Mizuhopecten yessoensis TaxID=6573 RepID=A0A210Q3W5_MIZYE|nr:beta-crystallin B2-like [Mizuhopecten yessoensis]OWF43433.1 Beta-crystallin B2 [Mizuhopecten yessoensis]